MSDPSSEQPLPDFRRQFVMFYLVNVPMEFAVTLDSPTFENQAGRLFVVGKMASSSSSDWSSGLKTCLAWDQVSQYLVFDSYDDYLARMEGEPGGGFSGFFGRN